MKIKRVYPKHGAWWFVDIARKWHRLGPLAMPEHELLDAIAALKSGTPTQNELEQTFDRYEREVLPKKAIKTQRDQAMQLATLRKAFKSFARLSQIKPIHIAQYLDARDGPTMANREIALLSHVFKKAIRWGKVATNPCTGVERNPERPRRHYAQDADFWRAWECSDQELRLLLELLYLSGQRPSDVLKVRESDIRDDGIYFRQSKTKKEIVIEWSPWLREVVQAARGLHPVRSLWLLADTQGQRFTYSAMAQRFRKVMVSFGGTPFRMGQDVRRKSGTDHPTGDHLGHADKRVRDRVYRVAPEHQRGVELDTELDSVGSLTSRNG